MVKQNQNQLLHGGINNINFLSNVRNQRSYLADNVGKFNHVLEYCYLNHNCTFFDTKSNGSNP